MMHFIIVEDLSSDRDHLLSLIDETCRAKNGAATFSCYQKAEDLLAGYRPGMANAIFLDILLDEMTGLIAARRVRQEDALVPIVFVTTEPDYSLESYEIHALDYLVKPVQKQQFSWCMNRILETSAAPLYLTVREARERDAAYERNILLDDLIYAESIRNGLIIHTTSGEIRTGQNYGFAEVLRLLPDTGQFCVFSRGELVNLSFVDLVTKAGEIRLKNGQTLYCSRRKTRDVQKQFAGYRLLQFRRGGAAK